MNNNKVLVVGGAGYIGSHVVKELFKNGYQPIVFDNLSTGKKENIIDGVLFIEGDIINYDQIKEALDGVGAVIHLAGLKSAGQSMIEPEKYATGNISGTINLLNAVSLSGIKNIIFSSSAAVYGNPKYLPIDENHPIEPINFYGQTKLITEDLLKWYSQIKGINYVALRYFNAVGYDVEGEIKGLEKNPSNLLPVVMEAIIGQRDHVEILGDDYDTPDGTCIRDYVHVSDLADAHVRALKYIDQENKNIIVNLGTANGLSVRQIVEAAKKISKMDFPVKISPRRLGDPAKIFSDSTRARELLGWQPKHSDLDTIIKTTLGAYGIIINS
ncbi:MAG: UDP-glucose 4-epimerase GalE [Candidatus Buchananbacteria bacterium]|nr:UDP-glucose 4-epimerase GalE [Candidatus Buchananbacteria bacterium]